LGGRLVPEREEGGQVGAVELEQGGGVALDGGVVASGGGQLDDLPVQVGGRLRIARAAQPLLEGAQAGGGRVDRGDRRDRAAAVARLGGQRGGGVAQPARVVGGAAPLGGGRAHAQERDP